MNFNHYLLAGFLCVRKHCSYIHTLSLCSLLSAEIVDDSDDEAWEDPNDDGLGSLDQDILIDVED